MKSELNFEDRQFLLDNFIEDNRDDGSEAYWRTPHEPEIYRMIDDVSTIIELAAIGSLIIRNEEKLAEDTEYFSPGGYDYDS